MPTRKFLLPWLKARRPVFFYAAAVFGFFILVYALHGYDMAVGFYTVLLGLAPGVLIAGWDLARFIAHGKMVEQLTMPEPKFALEENYQRVIAALQAERVRLEKENEYARRDAEEYYTLWAHQIKTPIAAAKLLMQSGGMKAELEQELFRIERYVDTALQYQRLSSIENDMLLKRFEISYLVKQAAKNCAGLFIYKGLALDAGGVSGSIVTDEKWFCFVLEQLFANAVKYTNEGIVRVYSDATPTLQRRCQPPNDVLPCHQSDATPTLVIEDTGIGIPAEDLPRVFERGFTGAVGRAERSATGIGLYLCRRVLARLGFGITVESEAGKGTKVILNISQESYENVR